MPPATTVSAEVLYTTATLVESFKVVPLAPTIFERPSCSRESQKPHQIWSRSIFTTGRKSSPRIARSFSKGTAVPREKH